MTRYCAMSVMEWDIHYFAGSWKSPNNTPTRFSRGYLEMSISHLLLIGVF